MSTPQSIYADGVEISLDRNQNYLGHPRLQIAISTDGETGAHWRMIADLDFEQALRLKYAIEDWIEERPK